MASSIRKAQSPLSCQLCENPNVIKWKCKDCELLMCDICKERIHPRFKLSETHSIISIKDVGKEGIDVSVQFESLQISQPVLSSLISTYTSTFACFGKIQYSSNDTLYCSYHTKEFGYKFFVIRFLKESIKVLHELDIKCTDFTLGRKDELYYGQFRGSELKVLSTDGVTNTVLSTAPMVILCIHINKDNEIILGLREQGPPFPVTEFSTRQIAVIDVNNKRKLSVEYDQNGEKLFTYVWRISTDSYDNIYTIDQFEKYDGRIVALERSGGVKFIYEGHSSINTSQTPFNPTDLVITKTDIILVCDNNNNHLYALNTKGEIIGLQTVTDLGIRCPFSMCFDSEGFLLIGCYDRKTVDANIHIAKIAL